MKKITRATIKACSTSHAYNYSEVDYTCPKCKMFILGVVWALDAGLGYTGLDRLEKRLKEAKKELKKYD